MFFNNDDQLVDHWEFPKWEEVQVCQANVKWLLRMPMIYKTSHNICIHIHTYITYVHTFIHTHTHTYIHTYTYIHSTRVDLLPKLVSNSYPNHKEAFLARESQPQIVQDTFLRARVQSPTIRFFIRNNHTQYAICTIRCTPL